MIVSCERTRRNCGSAYDSYYPHEKCLIKNSWPLPYCNNLFFFRFKAADRRGYIKILLLKNISHLRERSHKFNPNYYVEFSKIFKNNGTSLTEWSRHPRCSKVTSNKVTRWLTTQENVKRIEIGLRKPFDVEVFVNVIELPPRTAVVCSPNVQVPVGEPDSVYCLRQILKNVSHSSRQICCPRYIVRLPSQQAPSNFSPPMFCTETKWIWNHPDPLEVCNKEKWVRFITCSAKYKKFLRLRHYTWSKHENSPLSAYTAC